MEEIQEMREEVDEARRLAEEWENKYKDMQRQMSELETEPRIGKKHSKGNCKSISVSRISYFEPDFFI